MSFTDKARNKVEQMTGAAKERIGDMTDNERLRAEGASRQGTARARQEGQRAQQSRRDVEAPFSR